MHLHFTLLQSEPLVSCNNHKSSDCFQLQLISDCNSAYMRLVHAFTLLQSEPLVSYNNHKSSDCFISFMHLQLISDYINL